ARLDTRLFRRQRGLRQPATGQGGTPSQERAEGTREGVHGTRGHPRLCRAALPGARRRQHRHPTLRAEGGLCAARARRRPREAPRAGQRRGPAWLRRPPPLRRLASAAPPALGRAMTCSAACSAAPAPPRGR
ncbi:unnamed protein product, partial [Prorocentrum cordatum]